MADKSRLSYSEFNELQDFIYKKSGMFFPLSRKNYIEQKVFKRIESLRYKSFNDYLNILTKEPVRTEIINLFNEITVNETFFFRDLPQLEVLEKHIIPELIGRGRRRVEILSAGCSSGEEAFTISIILREKFPHMQFKITGIDISDLVVEKALRAEYTRYAVRFVPPTYREKYFIPIDGNNFKFLDQYKADVSFKKLNLMELDETKAILSATRFDVLFCRYVLIYFDKDSKQKVIDSFYERIADKGYLILGNSESLFSISNEFKMLHFPSAIIYHRK